LADITRICDHDGVRLLSLVRSLPGDADRPDLFVCRVDEALVNALEERASANGRSAEAEHREILAEARALTRNRAGATAASIPNVSTDAHFGRVGPGWEALRVVD
jgi:plasmid stability protein